MEEMKKIWILEKKEDDNWVSCVLSNNYYKFCGEAIRKLGEADLAAVQEYKKTLPPSNGVYSVQMNEGYKEVHNGVFAQYRVVQGQIPKESKSLEDYVKYDSKVNEGVYKYVWINKRVKKNDD